MGIDRGCSLGGQCCNWKNQRTPIWPRGSASVRLWKPSCPRTVLIALNPYRDLAWLHQHGHTPPVITLTRNLRPQLSGRDPGTSQLIRPTNHSAGLSKTRTAAASSALSGSFPLFLWSFCVPAMAEHSSAPFVARVACARQRSANRKGTGDSLSTIESVAASSHALRSSVDH
jgi:hypothetical protein